MIFSLPVEQVLSLGPRLVQDGALMTDHLVTGRIAGPSLFPQTLDILNNAVKLGIPIIGSGGVWSKENADAMISVGALAVQMNTALWNPANQITN